MDIIKQIEDILTILVFERGIAKNICEMIEEVNTYKEINDLLVNSFLTSKQTIRILSKINKYINIHKKSKLRFIINEKTKNSFVFITGICIYTGKYEYKYIGLDNYNKYIKINNLNLFSENNMKIILKMKYFTQHNKYINDAPKFSINEIISGINYNRKMIIDYFDILSRYDNRTFYYYGFHNFNNLLDYKRKHNCYDMLLTDYQNIKGFNKDKVETLFKNIFNIGTFERDMRNYFHLNDLNYKRITYSSFLIYIKSN